MLLICRRVSSPPTLPYSKPRADLDPHSYTTGRWLRDDTFQRQARHINFNFDALSKRVVELCHGAAYIRSCEKMDGGYNRVFKFTCDNEMQAIAKLPTSIAGPPALVTNSEAATISYLQSHTSVPIPHILDWNDDADDAIGHQYIISQCAGGIRLHERWLDMTDVQKIQCIRAIYDKIKEVAALNFNAYGSLYFSNFGAQQMPTTIQVDKQFCIGSHCGNRYWGRDVSESRYYHLVRPNRGPWTTFSAYCDGLLDVGYSRLPSQDANHDVCHRISAHENLLHNGREVLQSLSKDPRILKSANPTLFHPDLHMRNIFVSEDDPTIITGFIDWQSSSIEPAIEYTDDVPDFAAPTFESAEGKEEDQRSTDIICRTAVDACLHGLIPKLSYARSINGILLQPFRFCHRTWLDGPAAFREQLIQLAKSWTDVGMQGACPYEIPGPDALRDQASDYQALLTARGVSQQVINLLQVPSDGWVPVSDYKAKLRDNQEAFRMFLDVMKETPSASGKASSELEDDLRQIWPFDVGSDTSG